MRQAADAVDARRRTRAARGCPVAEDRVQSAKVSKPMVAQSYYHLLSIAPEASPEEIKRAYRMLAKRSHPDLFPESERERQQLRMMTINEAYMALLCERADGGRHPSSPLEGQDERSKGAGGASRAPIADDRAVGRLKDPAYTYYKLGFRYFSEGRRTFLKRYIMGEQRIDFTTENADVLKLAVVSLHYFHRAYGCFMTVARDYPASLWARDAEVKIYYLNRYNAIYQRICDNLSRQIKRKRPAA